MKEAAFSSRWVEICCAILLAAALAIIQALIGGARLLFSLPAYGLLAIAGLLTIFILRRPKPEPNQVCFASAALFFSYILARAFLSPVPYLARADIYSVLGGLLIYFFVACIFTKSKERMLLLSFLLALGIAHVVIGAIQFRHGDNFMPIPFLQRIDYGRRASGFYVCPNHLAGLLEVLGIFGLSIVCWSRWPPWAKLLVAYAVGVNYLGVALTASRGGYLSTVTSLLVFMALSLASLRRASSRTFWKVGGLGVVGAIIIGLTAVFLIKKSDYLSGRAQNTFETRNMRVEMWKAAFQQWKLQPIFGTGSGTYLFYGRQFRTERVQSDPVYVHNDYLHLLAEYGVIGGLLFLIFLGVHLRNGWKSFQRLGPEHTAVFARPLSNRLALQIGAIAAVSAYVVHSFLDFNLHIPANVMLLALVFGTLANGATQRELAAPRTRLSIVGWRIALPAIGLFVAIQCVRLLPGEYFAERSRVALREEHPGLGISFALRGLSFEQNNPNLYRFLGSGRIEEAQSMADSETRDSSYRAAIAAFEKGRALAPREKVFATALSFVYDALGRFAEAEWMSGEAIALDPNSKSMRRLYEMHLDNWRRSGIAAQPVFGPTDKRGP